MISLAIRPASGHARIRACQKGPVPRLLLPAWLAAAVAATRMCKSPQRTARASAPARARTGPSPLTRRRAAAAAPSRRSDFRRCFERCHGANVRLPPLAAPTAPQPASACWARWSPLPLRARSGPREPTARRLFGCGSGPVSQPEIRPIVLGAPGGVEPRGALLGGTARVACRAHTSRGQVLRPWRLCARASRHCAPPLSS